MTRNANARLAGVSLLFYIAVGIAVMVLGSATSAGGVAARLALVAEHEARVRLTIVMSLLTGLTALTVGAALYGLTRDEDHELAMLALVCRVCEGALGAFPVTTLGLLWLATKGGGADAPNAAVASGLAAFLLKLAVWKTTIAATLFAAGSALFSWLMLRGRVIPVALAWLGVVASLLLVVGLPLQLTGVLGGIMAQLMWLPMAAFEIPVALWLMVKGVAAPARHDRI